MKLFNKIVILIAIATSVVACGGNENQENTDETEISSQDIQVVDYAVEGMVCAMGCAATIQKDVASIDGVIVSDVNYADEKAHFEFDPAITSEEEIKAKIATIADGQYELSKWEEKGEVEKEETTTEEEEIVVEDESLVKVSLPSFEIPNLFTLLLNQL